MAKGNFSSIRRTIKHEKTLDAFVEAAKTDGNQRARKPKPGRRGRYCNDPKTGERILLGGKILEVPLNASETELLLRAAEISGLPLATFVRSQAVKSARKILIK